MKPNTGENKHKSFFAFTVFKQEGYILIETVVKM